ncbi:STAS domain-containing protein [Salirhabdus salicampi]|uniref:STAS domain-containing protein n=1 Tax=Salirhabdus salicampi TaxID=476102 RepID=UPI0020C260B2|nr:STAS domain-containing protein [Salirhabdus salicampi]MCP8615419.1 STAS domain-containing protein [Salirhabdus salicampi]
MKSLGKFPEFMSEVTVLNAINENIILADKAYNVIWLNEAAVQLMEHVVPLFNIDHVEDLIGVNMGHFHRKPAYQKSIMDNLTTTHSSRINIKDTYIADIIINPVKVEGEIKGYVVLLMDITTKAQEDERKEQLISELSVPILHIWENALAVPLIGPLDEKRLDKVIYKILNECKSRKADYVAIDLNGVTEWTEEIRYQLERMVQALKVMGADPLIVGIKPQLAKHLHGFSDQEQFFTSTKAATEYIISKNK